MNSQARTLLILGALTTALVSLSLGCAARYRQVTKGKGADQNNLPELNPGADVSTSPGQLPRLMAPTAGLEVVVGGQVVTRVKVGEALILRPTPTTLDPDDAAVTGCPHPGIVKARYWANRQTLVAERPAGDCGPLAVSTALTTPGTHLLVLEVTSDEGELASAAVTVEALPEGAGSPPPDDGFTISATPLLAAPLETVSFAGVCKGSAVVITWDFGDQATASGAAVTHAYQKPGQYLAEARCTREGGPTQDAWVSIAVAGPAGNVPTAPQNKPLEELVDEKSGGTPPAGGVDLGQATKPTGSGGASDPGPADEVDQGDSSTLPPPPPGSTPPGNTPPGNTPPGGGETSTPSTPTPAAPSSSTDSKTGQNPNTPVQNGPSQAPVQTSP